MSENKNFVTGIVLTTHERELIQAYMFKTGSLNFSETVRRIIREWDDLKHTQPDQLPVAVEQ